MAILQGPLHSLTARGSIADTLTYARLGSTSYVKSYAAPANPNTTPQQAVRLGLSFITKTYPN